MYIEVLHDAEGNIVACYCADTLPVVSDQPLFTITGEQPSGYAQARINIDTMAAMEIDAACGTKAVMRDDKPEVVTVDRSVHIRERYMVDVSSEITPPAGIILPEGMKVRGLKRRSV